MSFSHHVIIFEEYFLPQEDFKCNNIKFIFEFFKKTFFLAKMKKKFRGKHPKYNEFITIGELPKKNVLSIPAFNLRKKIDGETLYMDSDQKIFSTEILKNASLVTPIGF